MVSRCDRRRPVLRGGLQQPGAPLSGPRTGRSGDRPLRPGARESAEERRRDEQSGVALFRDRDRAARRGRSGSVPSTRIRSTRRRSTTSPGSPCPKGTTPPPAGFSIVRSRSIRTTAMPASTARCCCAGTAISRGRGGSSRWPRRTRVREARRAFSWRSWTSSPDSRVLPRPGSRRRGASSATARMSSTRWESPTRASTTFRRRLRC